MLTRYKIQVDQKTKEIDKLRTTLENTNQELIKVKKILEQKNRKETNSYINSHANPDIQNHYNVKLKALKKQNSNLKERLRSYTLQEKRILIKERAFELERADTANKIINLKDSITKLKIENHHLKNKKKDLL